jgi:hypothetical protein
MFCFDPRFPVGGSWQAAVRWSLAPLGPRKLAYAAIRFKFPARFRLLRLFAVENYWSACDMSHLVDGDWLADFSDTNEIGTMVATSDRLTAHLEASMRYEGFYGYKLLGSSQTQLDQLGSRLTLYYYEE